MYGFNLTLTYTCNAKVKYVSSSIDKNCGLHPFRKFGLPQFQFVFEATPYTPYTPSFRVSYNFFLCPVPEGWRVYYSLIACQLKHTSYQVKNGKGFI